MASFVGPRYPDEVAKSKIPGSKEITVYFINYLLVHPKGETVEVKKGVDAKTGDPLHKTLLVEGLPKNHHPVILSNNDSIHLPPLGEAITVRRAVVDDLKQRTEVFHPTRGRFEGFTESLVLAKAIRAAFDAGRMDSNDFESVETFESLLLGVNQANVLSALSVEELAEELKKRKLAEKKEDEAEPVTSSKGKTLVSKAKNS